MSRVPRIRFKGFEEDWEQRKLGEVANIVGGGTPSTSNEKYWDGNIDWYAPAEIGEQIYAFGSIRKITEEGLKHSSAKLLPAFKTVLFTSRAGIGNMAVLQKDGATNQGFQSIVCNDSLVPYFVFSMGFQIKKKAERVAAGSTFSEISGKQLCDLEIMVTTDKEQLKIGSYFQSLDHLITLHQSKCFEYVFVDAACHTLSWEQRKLLSITTMHARIGWQNLRTTEFLDDGNYLLITGTDFVDGKINFARCYYVEQERYNQDRNIQIKNGCILITKDGTLGKVAYVKGLNKPATLNAGIFNVEIRDSNQVDRIYLYQYIKAPFLLEYVNHMATGGTIKHLNQNILVDFLVSMPQSIEQKKIGGLFQLLDHLITLHQLEPYYRIFKAIAYRIIDYAEYKFF